MARAMKVAIVDDEQDMRQSISQWLALSGFDTETFPSAEEALKSISADYPGVVVSDIKMPGMDGMAFLKRLMGLDSGLPVIMITGHGDVPMAVEAMKAGAMDFIEKPFEDEVLLDAIRRAANELEARAGREDDAPVIRARLETLTDRERQVLSGVVAGLANKTIAYDLDISPRTVEVYRANVMAKMQAKSLPELVRMMLSASV